MDMRGRCAQPSFDDEACLLDRGQSADLLAIAVKQSKVAGALLYHYTGAIIGTSASGTQ